MKWIIILQFLLVSTLSITPIESKDISCSILYLEQTDVNAPIIENDPIKPGKETNSKFLVLTSPFAISQSEKLIHQFQKREIFNSHLTSILLGRGPPTSLS